MNLIGLFGQGPGIGISSLGYAYLATYDLGVMVAKKWDWETVTFGNGLSKKYGGPHIQNEMGYDAGDMIWIYGTGAL